MLFTLSRSMVIFICIILKLVLVLLNMKRISCDIILSTAPHETADGIICVNRQKNKYAIYKVFCISLCNPVFYQLTILYTILLHLYSTNFIEIVLFVQIRCMFTLLKLIKKNLCLFIVKLCLLMKL